MKHPCTKKGLTFVMIVAILVGGFFISVGKTLADFDHNLVFTASPSPAIITQSALIPETNGTSTGGNSVVDVATAKLTPIVVSLINNDSATSANVRISLIGDLSGHLQLWAKDSSGNWYDINVTGWGDPTNGFAVPTGYDATTSVYAISNQAGTYNLTPNLVYITGGTAISATETIIVNPTLSKIAITALPTKTIYNINDIPDITGLVITGTYSDGSTSTEQIVSTDISGFDSSTAKYNEPITITYGGQTATYNIDILPAPATIFIDKLQPSWDNGVWSAYYGPSNDYDATSPGSTVIYDQREAALIYAGVNIDPTDKKYEDQGLFGFKPGNVPVVTFATQSLTYDFENQYGTAPVWVYIELNKNAAGDTMYQYVPTVNSTGWHTEDAATGMHWQAWTDTENGIVTGPMLSLSDIARANAGKTVDRVYLTEGIGDYYHSNASGTVAWVDKVVIGRTTYNFATAGEASLPAGSTSITLTNNTVLDLSNAVTSTASATVVIGNSTTTLTQKVTLNSGTLGSPITLTNANLSSASVSIPDGTTIQGPTAWDGKIMPPLADSPGGNAPAGFSVGDTIVSIGSTAGTLVFDKPVTILLTGVTGAVGYKPAGSTDWTQIINTCAGNYAAPTAPAAPGECYVNNGVDTKIVTFHFTSFGGLTPIPAPVIATTGGGGILPTTPCAAVLYSTWGACINGRQYRDFVSAQPSGCQLTAKQRDDASRVCGQTAKVTPVNKGKAQTVAKINKTTAKAVAQSIVLGTKVYANGTLLKASGPKIYAMLKGRLYHIPNPKALAIYRNRHNIIKISDVELKQLLTIGKK